MNRLQNLGGILLVLALSGCAQTHPEPWARTIKENKNLEIYTTTFLLSEKRMNPAESPKPFLTINAYFSPDQVSAYQMARETDQGVYDRWVSLDEGRRTLMFMGKWLPGLDRSATNRLVALDKWVELLKSNAHNPTLVTVNGEISFITDQLPESFINSKVVSPEHHVWLKIAPDSSRITQARVETFSKGYSGSITSWQCFRASMPLNLRQLLSTHMSRFENEHCDSAWEETPGGS